MLPASEYSLALWKYTSTNWSSSGKATLVSWRLAEMTNSLLLLPMQSLPPRYLRGIRGGLWAMAGTAGSDFGLILPTQYCQPVTYTRRGEANPATREHPSN